MDVNPNMNYIFPIWQIEIWHKTWLDNSVFVCNQRTQICNGQSEASKIIRTLFKLAQLTEAEANFLDSIL